MSDGYVLDKDLFSTDIEVQERPPDRPEEEADRPEQDEEREEEEK
jgi:hypothetical protein